MYIVEIFKTGRNIQYITRIIYTLQGSMIQ